MSVTILTKDTGEIRDIFRKECGFVCELEDEIEEWIKKDLGVLE